MENQKSNTAKYILFALLGLIIGVGASVLVVFLTKDKEESKGSQVSSYVASSDKVEGDGFDTPEEAVEAYLNAYASGNMDSVYQCFAIESSVSNYTAQAVIERLQAYQPSVPKLPIYGNLSYNINVEYRKSEITKTILNHYRILMNWPMETGYTVISMEDYDSADQLIAEWMPDNESGLSNGITIDKIYSDSDIALDNWNSDNMLIAKERMCDALNAEEIQSVTAVFHTEQGYFMWFAGAVKYNGKWYLDYNAAMFSSFVGIESTCSGMVYLGTSYNEGLFAEYFK